MNRNFAGMPFGPQIKLRERVDIMKKVKNACKGMQGELQGKFYAHSTMSEEKKRQLEDDDLIFDEGDRLRASGGFNRDWPEGRAIFHNNLKTLLVWVNEEDHVRIISMQKGHDIKSIFARLCAASEVIEKESKYAYD